MAYVRLLRTHHMSYPNRSRRRPGDTASADAGLRRCVDGASDVRVVHARGVGNEIGVLLLAWLLAGRAEGP